MKDFSLEDYRKMLTTLRQAGYAFVKFHEAYNLDASTPFIILRHDIDFCVDSAMKIAQLETEEHIQSTYFLLPRSPLYNLCDGKIIDLISEISRQGHDIGLHFAPANYNNDRLEGLEQELKMLSVLFPFANTSIISLHRPGKLADVQKVHFPNAMHTYERAFTEQVDYVSDSAGVWRNGDPWSRDSFKNRRPIQILTHPLWWVEQGNTPSQVITEFLRRKNALNAEYLRQNLSFSF